MSLKKAATPQSSPQPGGQVDFLVRTMIERESTGKRRIRPKDVQDLLQSAIAEESDDPDFDCSDSNSDSDGSAQESDDSSNTNSSNNEGNGDGKGLKLQDLDDSSDSDDEDYQGQESAASSNDSDDDSAVDSSDDNEDDDDSDEPKVTKKSALQETLRKINNDENEFAVKPKKSAKKKRKKTNPEGDKTKGTKVSKKSVKATSSESKSSKSKSKKSKVAKPAVKVSKLSSKTKKGVAAKKVKASKKFLTEKKKGKEKDKGTDKSKSREHTIFDLFSDTNIHLKENRSNMEVTKPVCSACLGDNSDDSNEIVECDSCGISVHEICYGLFPDNGSVSSGSGSSSCTEPWFCDVCKSDSDNSQIHCELCPVEGGLFKESTAGRWVHLVCAMYTQRVALHNDSTVNLYEIPYSRWGSHNCAACEDERKAQTGIVVCCDAGLCKTHFHATCAQKLGLLSDPNQVDFAEADPYYVNCKLHSNREIMKRRIKLFNTLQEQLRIKRDRKEKTGLPSGANADHSRIIRKLKKVQSKTALKRAQYLNSLDNVSSTELVLAAEQLDQLGSNQLSNLPASWLNGNKKQRLLHTSAGLHSSFLRKIDRLGEDLAAEELEVKHEKIATNVKKKWNVLPSIGVEFAAYYADREHRIKSLVDQQNKFVSENQELIDKDTALKDNWEVHAVNKIEMEEENSKVSKNLQSLAGILMALNPGDKKISAKLHTLVKPKELQGIRRKSPSMSKGDRKSPSPRRSSTSKKAHKSRISSSPSRRLAMALCDTCAKSDNQHLITRCDKCGKHYHLGCLDPPLERMPKRSRQLGWMCSDCCDATSEEDDQVDIEAPRTLRGRTKIHKPRKYRGSDDSENESKPQSTDISPKTSKKTKSIKSPDGAKLPASSPTQSTVKSPSTDKPHRKRSGTKVPLASPVIKIEVPSDSSVVVQEVSSQQPPLAVDLLGDNFAFITEPKDSFKKTVLDKQSSVELKPKVEKKSKSPKIKLSPNKNEKIGPVKKKRSSKQKITSDGPLTDCKVNGLSETPVSKDEGKENPVKRKRQSKAKKDKTQSPSVESLIPSKAISMVVNEMVSQVELPNVALVPVTHKVDAKGNPKKPRKKKDVKSLPEEILNMTTSNISPEMNSTQDATVTPKTKKPRKRKTNKNETLNSENDAVVTGPLVESTKNVGKGKDPKAASKKPRIPKNKGKNSTLSTPIRNGTIGNVDMNFEMVATQVFGVKNKTQTPVKNGVVKPKLSRKRKSIAVIPALPEINNTSVVVSPSLAPEEKEKSVPPKKRKRAPSSAQTQQQSVNNSFNVDNVIQAVSIGEGSTHAANENGETSVTPKELSGFMQNITTPNRQLTTGQDIMKGKAMGIGENSGETITFDTSFLLDSLGSDQSTFRNDAAPVFYAASNHAASGIPHDGTHIASSHQLHASNGTSNQSDNTNVIRLQYCDSGESSVLVSSSDSASTTSIVTAGSVPPRPIDEKSAVVGGLNGVCATCIKSDSRVQLVMCDKCSLEFHFSCLNPSLNETPRKKGQRWFCENCSEGASRQNGVGVHSLD